MTEKHIPRIQLISDETVQTVHSHVAIARIAVEAGLDGVQFREKRPWTTRQLTDVAARMLAVCQDSPTTLVVDDRVDVARSAGANAVHLGANDLDVATARAILGQGAIIGRTANSYAEAERVWHSGADYLGVGPIYGTRSKANPAPIMGLETLGRICRDSPVPVVAIGSITVGRIPEVLATGAHGVAVLSAVLLAPDPFAAARDCRRALDEALEAAAT